MLVKKIRDTGGALLWSTGLTKPLGGCICMRILESHQVTLTEYTWMKRKSANRRPSVGYYEFMSVHGMIKDYHNKQQLYFQSQTLRL